MDTRDERLSIIEIQQNLRELAKAGWDLPSITADGIYGQQTREAVRRFQEIEGLPVTGRVDLTTWEVLHTAARAGKWERSPATPISPWNRPLAGGTTQPGERTDLIYIVQLMLRESLPYDFDLPLTGVLDAATRDALLRFQQINRIPQTGLIDRITWDALADAYNKYLPQIGDQ
ncbi:MAG: peptidoglycan-binding protein [Clostridia bacterium]|nr:peptidoglycan-binding protein [Clostridia bacterium]